MTPDAALRFAGRLARAAERILGGATDAVVLHGSLTLGDYIPGRSDVDLLAIVAQPLRDEQAEALAAAVVAERRGPARAVDFRVVTREVAARPTPAPPMELWVADYAAREPSVVSRHPGEPDLAVELAICRAHGRSLVGRAPHELIGEVPDEWLVEIGEARLAKWHDVPASRRDAASIIVVTACRIWLFAEERRHVSKAAAAEWALARDPTLTAVRAALERPRAGTTVSIDDADVLHVLAAARAAVARAR